MPDADLDALSEHERRNRASWNADAPAWVEAGRRHWSSPEPVWGMFDVPEPDVNILPDVAGLDVVELGCGTAYWSAWLARLGARPVGVDLSERQLETAAMLQREHDLSFPLVHASAEAVPLPDGTFDFAFSEYGAAIWCEPAAWLPEASRLLLRPGGRLIFLVNSVLAMLCALESEDKSAPACSGPSSACGGLSGPVRRPWTFTFLMARCSACCAKPASRSRRSTNFKLRRVPK